MLQLRSWNCNFGTIWLAEMEVWLEARGVLEKLNIFIFIVRAESWEPCVTRTSSNILTEETWLTTLHWAKTRETSDIASWWFLFTVWPEMNNTLVVEIQSLWHNCTMSHLMKQENWNVQGSLGRDDQWSHREKIMSAASDEDYNKWEKFISRLRVRSRRRPWSVRLTRICRPRDQSASGW